MQYIDMHCDTLIEALAQKQKTAETLEGTMLDVTRLQKSGAMAQFFAMFLPQRQLKGQAGAERMPEHGELLDGMYRIYQNTMEKCHGVIAPAGNITELERNKKAGKISAFLTIENGYPILGKLENVKKFYDMGVRLITLTWNDPNCLGFCHSANSEEMQRGLTDFGKEAVFYMQEQGILVDVSHLSDGGFYDVAALAKRSRIPFVASHSNCRALSPATRNLTDEMIRTLADCGGVAGINFEPSFLNADITDKNSRVERMCDHICHLIDKGGSECVGIGTDFDGIRGELEIDQCTKTQLLFDTLCRRGISVDVIEKIAYKNAARVIREGMH